MKSFNYSFSESDVKTFLCTLSIMPQIDFDGIPESQKDINDSCCLSAIEKLLNSRTDFHPNEVRVMAVSLDLSDAILQGELEASEEIKNELSPYVFSIKKLLPIFDVLFD